MVWDIFESYDCESTRMLVPSHRNLAYRSWRSSVNVVKGLYHRPAWFRIVGSVAIYIVLSPLDYVLS